MSLFLVSDDNIFFCVAYTKDRPQSCSQPNDIFTYETNEESTTFLDIFDDIFFFISWICDSLHFVLYCSESHKIFGSKLVPTNKKFKLKFFSPEDGVALEYLMAFMCFRGLNAPANRAHPAFCGHEDTFSPKIEMVMVKMHQVLLE